MKIFSTILILLFLAGCSGHIAPPAVKFGKKCTVAEDGNVVHLTFGYTKKARN